MKLNGKMKYIRRLLKSPFTSPVAFGFYKKKTRAKIKHFLGIEFLAKSPTQYNIAFCSNSILFQQKLKKKQY